jgi:RimJ/RimL family protein N-acetyltransferase
MTTNLDAMDGYIQWGSSTSEKIQFRSFGGESSLTGWQGEIKGTSANQGKISLGPINFIHKYAEISYFIGEKSFWNKGYATKGSLFHNENEFLSICLAVCHYF